MRAIEAATIVPVDRRRAATRITDRFPTAGVVRRHLTEKPPKTRRREPKSKPLLLHSSKSNTRPRLVLYLYYQDSLSDFDI
jgi:hypothetical protein